MCVTVRDSLIFRKKNILKKLSDTFQAALILLPFE